MLSLFTADAFVLRTGDSIGSGWFLKLMWCREGEGGEERGRERGRGRCRGGGGRGRGGGERGREGQIKNIFVCFVCVYTLAVRKTSALLTYTYVNASCAIRVGMSRIIVSLHTCLLRHCYSRYSSAFRRPCCFKSGYKTVLRSKQGHILCYFI